MKGPEQVNPPLHLTSFLSYGISRRLVWVLPLFMIAGLRTVISRFYDGNEENTIKKSLDEQTLMQNALNNGWISNADIIEFTRPKNTTTALQRDKAAPYVAYKPSLTKYPINQLQNITAPLLPSDVLYVWHIPKAAGSTVKHIMMKCFHLTRAEMKQVPESFTLVNGVLNIDTSTIAGIYRAKQMGLVDSNFVDVVESSYLHEGAALFTNNHKGRLFTVMRHPVDTAISLFYYLGWAAWERKYQPELVNMTLLDYIQSNKTDLRVDNWMTRYLSRRIKGPLEERHLQLAKDILKTKCLVGMSANMTESINRLAIYAGLGDAANRINNIRGNDTSWSDCVDDYNKNRVNEHKHESFKPGSVEWELLAKENVFDVQLFTFAEQVWSEQSDMIKQMENEFRQWNYRPKPPKNND